MMHMGFFPKHASTVSVALNLETGSLTPNWNVVFDDWLATVGSTVEELPDHPNGPRCLAMQHTFNPLMVLMMMLSITSPTPLHHQLKAKLKEQQLSWTNILHLLLCLLRGSCNLLSIRGNSPHLTNKGSYFLPQLSLLSEQLQAL